MQENIWKIVAVCYVSKNAALPQVFFCYTLRTVPKNFQSFSTFFQSISTNLSVPFKCMHAFIYQMKDADFWSNSSW